MAIDVSHTVLIDFDGCMAPFAFPNPVPPPYDGVRETIRKFRAAGWRVLLFTGRASRIWSKEDRTKQLLEVDEWLNQHDIEVDGITSDKVPSAWVIDDRAINPFYSRSLNRPQDPEEFWREAFELLTKRLKKDRYGE